MEVSKLTLSESLRSQESTQTKILRWIKEHPNLARNTNVSILSKTLCVDEELDLGLTEGSTTQAFHRLLRKGLLERNGGVRRATFSINYFHPEVPPQLKEGLALMTTMAKSEPEVVEEEKTESEKTEREESATPTITVEQDRDGGMKLSITLNINLGQR